ncbi:hypothetical protein F441_04973 [Phytophthora nicotianae CJ01A1]|uniref:Uncharacterized protein n=4 Tax=Phytophthora nicotianae TaxID=4792 RepID=V9FLS5_PHYNI|nr:hypothetical protein F443_04966 [Phytophthora nicotianae P1569]ETK91635.1 hypothetical protein L915_04836 [Phytophthora nicotianae]ETL45046.1 hypothetical protein L916_04781 [Phytophthora nicotianae]ETO80473.1 hypothetical protein F444_05014 [Phytophthora nicotianae P1976]ETP21500.1 hypothetical protein F441_04973 [Phytophthora nicotianae CJ01A1]
MLSVNTVAPGTTLAKLHHNGRSQLTCTFTPLGTGRVPESSNPFPRTR